MASNSGPQQAPIMSTAGAIPIKNEKGEVVMQKVKVSRYVSGKRPDYAAQESSDEDELEFGIGKKRTTLPVIRTEAELGDRRLRRLRAAREGGSEEEEEEEDEEGGGRDKRLSRHRRIHEPEVLGDDSDAESEGGRLDDMGEPSRLRRADDSSSEEDEDEELNEEEIAERRAAMRQKARQRIQEEEVLDKEEEASEGESEEESSEYEEYSESDEETGPRLKPVFVRKKDRITIQEKEKEEQKLKDLDAESKRLAEERRRTTLKIIEDDARRELEETRETLTAMEAAVTDDENDEEEYEAWKVRELKRIKRDKEEREQKDKEKIDLERMHAMTEDERRAEFHANPKLVTNKAQKGKYKFLQKYYHRGSFFVQEEEADVYKRDFAKPTLEDHFDKSILPKVMQVKNFGRSGRTKYTHLVDQDTTNFESPWMNDSAQNLKFHTAKGGGMKQAFDRPGVHKNKR